MRKIPPSCTLRLTQWILFVYCAGRYTFGLLVTTVVLPINLHSTVNQEIFVIEIGGDPLPYTLSLYMRLIFVCLIFVARTDYENKLTTKISRFTVHGFVQDGP